jgi:hypothetical protein
LARYLTVGMGALATLTALLFSDMEGVIKGVHQVGAYVGAPVTALFLMGLLTRRGHFLGWLTASLAVVLPLTYYVQHYSPVHWLLYGPISTGACLLAGYLCSRILRPPAWAPAEPLTVWRNQTLSGTTNGAR